MGIKGAVTPPRRRDGACRHQQACAAAAAPHRTLEVVKRVLQVPALEPPHVGEGGGGGTPQARCGSSAGGRGDWHHSPHHRA